jgi:hypothetical protein
MRKRMRSWENWEMSWIPKPIRELQPHALWYFVERVLIAGLIGEGGGRMFNVKAIDLTLLTLGVVDRPAGLPLGLPILA